MKKFIVGDFVEILQEYHEYCVWTYIGIIKKINVASDKPYKIEVMRINKKGKTHYDGVHYSAYSYEEIQ
ncbi:MAG: hypothetical protein WC679_01960 [Bacteroidales bacterium]|jgi:hypothetical protein